jgi:hypothetical protein
MFMVMETWYFMIAPSLCSLVSLVVATGDGKRIAATAMNATFRDAAGRRRTLKSGVDRCIFPE